MATDIQRELPDILNNRQAAHLLDIHRDTLTHLARQGKIPHGVIGGRYRYSRRALMAFVSRTDRTGQIKKTRRLVDFPPELLIARVEKLGGQWVLEDGKVRVLGLKRLPRALASAVKQNLDGIKEELERQQRSEALFQRAEKMLSSARAARGVRP